jgi:hypothetical protein
MYVLTKGFGKIYPVWPVLDTYQARKLSTLGDQTCKEVNEASEC